MENKTVGYIVTGIGLVVGLIIVLFNRALTEIVNTTCSHGPSCPMYTSIKFQTWISGIIMGAIIVVGLYLIFASKRKHDAPVHKPKLPKDLTKDEKTVVDKLTAADGTIFQSDLVEQTGFTKVKVTRMLDRLEGRGLIERKRRGMTNVVILKN